MIDRLLQDLRYAARTFRRAPGFLLLVVLTIGVGVGASAAIFSIVSAVLLRPLPFPRPNDLVLVTDTDRETKQNVGDTSPATFLDWRARQRSFTAMAAFRQTRFTFTGVDHPESVTGAIVNASFFDVLGVGPALGRGLDDADGQPGAPRVAILSDALWRQRFGARADALGRMTRFNDEPYTIVGVMPPGIDYPDKSRVWVTPHWRVPDDPLAPDVDPAAQRDHGYLFVLARLRPGLTLDRGQSDMEDVAVTIARDFPTGNPNRGALLTPLRSDLVADVRQTVLLLFAAVGLLLLIAAANVSGLLIARAAGRQHEMAVRIALGASRRRILVQLLTESTVLALLGGAAGVLLALWLIGPLVSLSPADLDVAGTIAIDRGVLVFCLAVSTLAGLLVGLAPAFHLTRTEVQSGLTHTARSGSGTGQQRVRALLVTGEIALSLVLLVSAGLTVRSFVVVQREPTGFNPDHVLTMTVNLPAARYRTPEQKAAFWQRAIEGLQRVPGIEIAAATSRLPLVPGNSTRGLTIGSLPPNARGSADYRTASPDYFRAMGIQVLQGRAFNEADREGRPLVSVISASAAKRFWPGRSPLGEQFAIDEAPITVVGVVADVHAAALDRPPEATVYVPYRQDPWPFMTFALRTSAPPSALGSAAREAVWQVDREQPVGAVLTMDEQLSHSLMRRRFSVTLLTAFGATALLLGAVGLYGVLAFVVAQRRREIGVRMALGARPRDVMTDILAHGLRLAGVGVIVGLGLAFAVTRLLNALLFGTSPTDATTFAGVALLLAAVAAAASVVPAVRASRIDPLIALRDD